LVVVQIEVIHRLLACQTELDTYSGRSFRAPELTIGSLIEEGLTVMSTTFYHRSHKESAAQRTVIAEAERD